MRKPLTFALGLVSLGFAHVSPALSLPKTCDQTWAICVTNAELNCAHPERCAQRCDQKLLICFDEHAASNPNPPNYQPTGNPHPKNQDPGSGPGPGKGAGGKGKGSHDTPIVIVPTTLKPPGVAPAGGISPRGSSTLRKAF
jgi:hypothetical protein